MAAETCTDAVHGPPSTAQDAQVAFDWGRVSRDGVWRISAGVGWQHFWDEGPDAGRTKIWAEAPAYLNVALTAASADAANYSGILRITPKVGVDQARGGPALPFGEVVFEVLAQHGLFAKALDQ